MNIYANLTKIQWAIRFMLWAVIIGILLMVSNVDLLKWQLSLLILVFILYRISADIGSPFPKKILLRDFMIYMMFLGACFVSIAIFESAIIMFIFVLAYLFGYGFWIKGYYAKHVKQLSEQAIQSKDAEDIKQALQLIRYNRNFSLLKDDKGNTYLSILEKMEKKFMK